MTVEHSAIPDANLHEPKGAASASVDKVWVADGAGSGTHKKLEAVSLDGTEGSNKQTLVTDGSTASWVDPVRMGWYDYNDVTTQSSAIALTSAGTQYELTNDGAGTYSTSDYGLDELTDIWDSSTDRFDFSDLNIGDTVDVRVDVEFTTSTNNTGISLDIEFGIGGTPFQIPIIKDFDLDQSGASQQVYLTSFYIGSTGVRDNPARVLASASKTGTTVKVNGWYVRVITRGA